MSGASGEVACLLLLAAARYNSLTHFRASLCHLTQLTHALSYSLWATIRVLSNMSTPGPDAIHISLGPEHVLLCASHGRPLNWHRAPLTFGDTSPKLLDAKVATK